MFLTPPWSIAPAGVFGLDDRPSKPVGFVRLDRHTGCKKRRRATRPPYKETQMKEEDHARSSLLGAYLFPPVDVR